mgnify:CR=1 FL=1
MQERRGWDATYRHLALRCDLEAADLPVADSSVGASRRAGLQEF